MFSRIISHISSGFIILLAFITIIYEVNQQETLPKIAKMYPYFNDIKSQINRIDIRFPDGSVLLEADKNGKWSVVTADNFPVDIDTLIRLYQDIENMTLVASKTQKPINFPRLNLLNPNLQENNDHEGIRVTFFTGDGDSNKKPVIDFIVGEKLNSYANQNHIRLFTRYANNGGAYLAEATSDFNYSPSNFLTKDFGMPSLDEIVSASLRINDENVLNLYRVVDKNNPKKILFVPPRIPENKKLLYPLVMRDYMMAFVNQLRPIDAMYIPVKRAIAQTSMVLELTKSRLVKINFWNADKGYYMRILRDDVQSPHSYYIYEITKNDYDTLIQPLDKFLTDDLSQKIPKITEKKQNN